MGDLVAFLAARLDEDEAEANAQMAGVCSRCGSWGVPHACTGIRVINSNALHPARVLREVAAGRARIALYAAAAADAAELQRGLHYVVRDALLEVLQADAAVYSDHPDYDPAWAPQ